MLTNEQRYDAVQAALVDAGCLEGARVNVYGHVCDDGSEWISATWQQWEQVEPEED